MMDRVHRDPLVDVRQGWRLHTCCQIGDVVAAQLVANEGNTVTVHADYLIGCDGASSCVRTELGIGMDGLKDFTTFALVHFRSLDLTNLHALGQFWHLYTSNGAVLIAQNETDTWTLHLDLGAHADDPDPMGDPREFVARALGRPIGDCNRNACVENAMVILQYRDMVDPQLIEADDASGQAHREQIAGFLAANDAENLSLGIELDVRYDESPVVVPDGSAAPSWDRKTFVATVRPGHRAPNPVVGGQGWRAGHAVC